MRMQRRDSSVTIVATLTAGKITVKFSLGLISWASTPWYRMQWRYTSTIINLGTIWMSGQHHVSTILPGGKNPSTHWMDPVVYQTANPPSSTVQHVDNRGAFSAVAETPASTTASRRSDVQTSTGTHPASFLGGNVAGDVKPTTRLYRQGGSLILEIVLPCIGGDYRRGLDWWMDLLTNYSR
jgi:hypothetical protein